MQAASFRVAEQYIHAFGNIAKEVKKYFNNNNLLAILGLI